MPLSDEDRKKLAKLRAELEADDEPEDKVNGKSRRKGTPDEEDAPTPGARPKRTGKVVEVEVEVSDEDEDADPPADKRPTKAPPAKRTRRQDADPSEEPAPPKTAGEILAARTMLAAACTAAAVEFADKDADMASVVEIAFEFADALLASK